ncbi:DUF6471 domain-containing protein [Paraburkholderia tropica]|uniref:DUF6471 domain-containing protein n=1 Tax=Paraburkholderia tropica TaxID=92647 RepID=UPI0031DAAE75
MGEELSPWAELASRVIRVALARCNRGYAEVATALNEMGFSEGEHALSVRVSRGTIKFTLLLQILTISGDEPPSLWRAALASDASWEVRARDVMSAELSEQPWIALPEIVRRLATIGVITTEKTLRSHFAAGTFSLSLFIQCMTVLRSSSLASYVSTRALASAVTSSRMTADQNQ